MALSGESALSFWKPNLWLFVDLFLKVGKWVLNCAAGDKLVVRWFIDGIVSAHVLQIRCYRGFKIRLIFWDVNGTSTWLFLGSVQKLDTWSLWPQLGHSSRPSKSKWTNQIPSRKLEPIRTYRCLVPLDRTETVPSLPLDIFPVSENHYLHWWS